jgi:hypothetical protein
MEGRRDFSYNLAHFACRQQRLLFDACGYGPARLLVVRVRIGSRSQQCFSKMPLFAY